MAHSGAPDTGRSVFVTAPDGLRLHVRDYGSRIAHAFPVVCLPGLTRTVADFATLAPALARSPAKSPATSPGRSPAQGGQARRVIAIDSRGRGQSGYDSDPANYSLAVGSGDVVTVLTALGIGRAVFVGSSRGGLLTMLLGVAQPAAVAGAVLHDIGPVIEPTGLARLKSYVGKLPQPRDFAEGAEILRRLFGAQFPKLSPEQWLASAWNTWKTEDGALVPTYDVRLAYTLADIDLEHPLPALWNEFDALARVPLLLIHGANSDILSRDTITAMQAHHPDMAVIEVPDEGHVPLLDDDGLIARVARFVETCDAAAQPAAANAQSRDGGEPLLSSSTQG